MNRLARYTTDSGRAGSLVLPHFTPVIHRTERVESEAWHIVNGYAFEPAPALPIALPRALDYRDVPETRRPVHAALASIAILLIVVALSAVCVIVR